MNSKIVTSIVLLFISCHVMLGVQSEEQELVRLISDIEAIGAKAEHSVEDAEWLLKIIGSDNLAMHRVVFLDQKGLDRILYLPPSHYAIWILSRILEDPPYTYESKNWEELSFYMTGERKRWVEWRRENPIRIRSVHSSGSKPVNLAIELRRQTENKKLHMELSLKQARLEADKIYWEFAELEQLYVNGEEVPGSSEPLGAASNTRDSNQLASNHSSKNGSSSAASDRVDAKVNLEESSNLSTWILVVITGAVLGILILLMRAFSRGRAL